MRNAILVVLVVLLPCMVIGQIWIEHTVDDSFNGARSVYATDVDGDGDTDVLAAAYDADDISWWENLNGNGTSWTEHIVDNYFHGVRSVYAMDVDGDGDTDVLGAANHANDIAWWENINGTGTEWTEHTVDGDFDGAVSVYASDVDGDGDTDVLGAAHHANNITWWENFDGNGISWTEHPVGDDFMAPWSVFATDVDGDGDIDILGAANADDDITWWENADGTGTEWTEHTVDGDFDGAFSVYATDVDGDSDTDVLGAAREADHITWWENTDGTGTEWTEHTVDGNFDAPESVYATDVDGDGDTDVLGAGNWAHEITWWENLDGLGTNWTEHTVDDYFYRAVTVFATDVDGDGDTDVLGAAASADDVTWWENVQPYITISIEPQNEPVIIPAPGGRFYFNALINNTSGQIHWFHAWTEATGPYGNIHGPLLLDYIGIYPYGEINATVSQGVPRFAPPGEYIYTAYVGFYPDLQMSLDSFSFTKICQDGPAEMAVDDWSITSTLSGDIAEQNTSRPTSFAVDPASPNPFNPTTTLTVSLPEPADLIVEVYNVTGQRVATLTSGQHAAGTHSLTFDGSSLASGIYFVHAKVPDQLDVMQKVILLK